jgi:hypothetical protein
MDKVLIMIGAFIGMLLFCAGLSLLFAWPFMWLWNYAVVEAIEVCNPIEYWVAFWLMWFISLTLVRGNSK